MADPLTTKHQTAPDASAVATTTPQVAPGHGTDLFARIAAPLGLIAPLRSAIVGAVLAVQPPPVVSGQDLEGPNVTTPALKTISGEEFAEKLLTLSTIKQEQEKNLRDAIGVLQAPDMRKLADRETRVQGLAKQLSQLSEGTTEQALRAAIEVSNGGEVSKVKALMAAHSLGLFDEATSAFVAQSILRSPEASTLAAEKVEVLQATIRGVPASAIGAAILQRGLAPEDSVEGRVFKQVRELKLEGEFTHLSELVRIGREICVAKGDDPERIGALLLRLHKFTGMDAKHGPDAPFAIFRTLLEGTMADTQKVAILKMAVPEVLQGLPAVMANSSVRPETVKSVLEVLPPVLRDRCEKVIALVTALKGVDPLPLATAASLVKPFKENWERVGLDVIPETLRPGATPQQLSYADVEAALTTPRVFRENGKVCTTLGAANRAVLSADPSDPRLREYRRLSGEVAERHLAALLHEYTSGKTRNEDLAPALVSFCLRYPGTPAAESIEPLVHTELQPLGLMPLYSRLMDIFKGEATGGAVEAIIDAHFRRPQVTCDNATWGDLVAILTRVAPGATAAESGALHLLSEAVATLPMNTRVFNEALTELFDGPSTDVGIDRQVALARLLTVAVGNPSLPPDLVKLEAERLAKLPIFRDFQSGSLDQSSREVVTELIDTILAAIERPGAEGSGNPTAPSALEALSALAAKGVFADRGDRLSGIIETLYHRKDYSTLNDLLGHLFIRVDTTPSMVRSLVEVGVGTAIAPEEAIPVGQARREFINKIGGVILYQMAISEVESARSDQISAEVTRLQAVIKEAIGKVITEPTSIQSKAADGERLRHLFSLLAGTSGWNHDETFSYLIDKVLKEPTDVTRFLHVWTDVSDVFRLPLEFTGTSPSSPDLLNEFLEENKKLIQSLLHIGSETDNKQATEAAIQLFQVVRVGQDNKALLHDPHKWLDLAVELALDSRWPPAMHSSASNFLSQMATSDLPEREELGKRFPQLNSSLKDGIEKMVMHLPEFRESMQRHLNRGTLREELVAPVKAALTR